MSIMKLDGFLHDPNAQTLSPLISFCNFSYTSLPHNACTFKDYPPSHTLLCPLHPLKGAYWISSNIVIAILNLFLLLPLYLSLYQLLQQQ